MSPQPYPGAVSVDGEDYAVMITEHSPTLKEYRFLTNADSDYMPEFEDMDAAPRASPDAHEMLVLQLAQRLP